MSTVVRVATRGGSSESWLTQYRLSYSDDCVYCNNILDAAGNNEVICSFNQVDGEHVGYIMI